MLRLIIAAAITLVLASAADARPRARSAIITCDQMGCSDWGLGRTESRASRSFEPASVASQIIPHPSGCPRRAFCGCGAAIRVFGHARRDLWLASNWLRFPRAAPAHGMAAARRGHVFVLESHVGGDLWLVTDHNSGGHLSRLHVRSIRGFTIVNPAG